MNEKRACELSADHDLNLLVMREELRADKSFDIIERHLLVAGADACFF